jgi:hypothetical protein
MPGSIDLMSGGAAPADREPRAPSVQSSLDDLASDLREFNTGLKAHSAGLVELAAAKPQIKRWQFELALKPESPIHERILGGDKIARRQAALHGSGGRPSVSADLGMYDGLHDP